jgi:hypothetical protein
MFFTEAKIGNFTVIFHANSFTNARTRQNAPGDPTHFRIYSIVKGNQYYILNDGDYMKSEGIELLNNHAFFSDEKSKRDAKSEMVSLKNGRTENKDLMYKLNQLLGNPIKPTPAPRRRRSLPRRRGSSPRRPSPRRRSTPTPAARRPTPSPRRRRSSVRNSTRYNRETPPPSYNQLFTKKIISNIIKTPN